MVTEPERLGEIYRAREENRLRPLEELVRGIEAQIDQDVEGGWGEIREEFFDRRDPRRVLVYLTVELDPELMTRLDDLDEAGRAAVERELQRRYMAAGFHSLTVLDEGRVRLAHLVEPDGGAKRRSGPAGPEDPSD